MPHYESTAEKNINHSLILYMIGHAPDAHYLERLLAQVKPVIKRISFVVTDEKDDCREVLEKSGIPFFINTYIPESRNSFDFGKARQLALAGCNATDDDWCIWLDCDDTIANPERIIEQMKAHQSDAYGLPYDVSASQSNLFKIRIHRAHEWRWQNKIHEELVPIDMDKRPSLLILKDCIVKHAPDEGKSNHKWHIELLKENSKNAPNEYAYIMKEHFNLGEWESAIEWAKKVFAIHPIEIEKFNAKLFEGIALTKLTRYEEGFEALHEAIKLRPWRREPYYFLAETMGILGNSWLEKGLGYIACCNAQPDRQEFGQNGIVYQIAGYKLHAKYLQKLEQYESAHQVMLKCKVLDGEGQEIIQELERQMIEKAVKERDAA